MKNIKVCHFTSVHHADDIRIFVKECTSLAEAGYDVTLVAVNTEEKRVNNVQIVNVTSNPKGRMERMLKTSKLVYQKALSIDADIYHFHDPELLRFGLKLKRKGKIVIYDAHEDVPKQIMGKFWIKKFLRRFISTSFRLFENYITKRLDVVITATPFIKDRFIQVNPNTVDINNFPLLSELVEKSDWDSKQDEICYTGGITEIRGLEYLVKTMGLLEDVKLNIAGKFSPGNNEFEGRLRANQGWNNVIEHGHVNRVQLREIFQKCKAGMVTFLPLPNHVDAQPNKMFEYMSAGIPVIASNFPLWRDIIEKNECGICVNPEDPEEISKAVKELINDTEKAKIMGENGRKAVIEKYNWDQEKMKLIALYKKLK